MAFSFGDFQSGEVEELLASTTSSQQQQHSEHQQLQFGAGGQNMGSGGLQFQQFYWNGNLGGQAGGAVDYTTPHTYGKYTSDDQMQQVTHVGEGVSYGAYAPQGQPTTFYGNGYQVPPSPQQHVAIEAATLQQQGQHQANGGVPGASIYGAQGVEAIAADATSAQKPEANGVRDAAAAVAAATNIERCAQ